MKTKLFITGLALMALTAMAGAQNNGADKNQQNTSVKCLAFIDANKNGICDNFESRTTTVPDGNSNGRCCVRRKQNGQGMGQGMGRGMGPGNGMGPGQRQGNGMGQGQGRNRNFVDADKNGVCDYYEASSKK